MCSGYVDQPAQVHCESCEDDYCEVCFAAQHRKGTRKRHASKALDGQLGKKTRVVQNGSTVSNGAEDKVSPSLSGPGSRSLGFPRRSVNVVLTGHGSLCLLDGR